MNTLKQLSWAQLIKANNIVKIYIKLYANMLKFFAEKNVSSKKLAEEFDVAHTQIQEMMKYGNQCRPRSDAAFCSI